MVFRLEIEQLVKSCKKVAFLYVLRVATS